LEEFLYGAWENVKHKLLGLSWEKCPVESGKKYNDLRNKYCSFIKPFGG
jgi:hypothetical protein